MATANLFLKITDKNGNQVEGECYDDKHLREIDLTSWNWDVEDPAVPGKSKSESDAGSKSKKSEGESDRSPKPSKLSFSKMTDRSTTRLLGAMDRGEVFPKAVLTVEEKFEESPFPFHMEIELTDVFVVAFKWRANAEAAGMTFSEDWELNYSNIHFSYHWRGGDAGWIQQKFDRPPDSSEGTSKKSPPTAAEQRAAEEERLKAILKKEMEKRGK